ncbi:asparaginase [Lysobacter sp. TAF61]|uniref:asparaginase n=1 Tax=Lysobacter sp. TAF61 TaxID=3233072 RepID=UPI003F9D3368
MDNSKRIPRRIALIACGGTISGVRERDGGFSPGRHAAELLSEVLVPPGVEIRALDASTVPSRAMSTNDVLGLIQQVDALEQWDEIDAVVISQGTDSLEETAYLFELISSARMPVVLTGAMRAGAMPGADGPANISAAIAVAAHEDAARHGPLVVLGDEVHCARWVTKAHSSRPAAFASPGCGPVGIVGEGRVRLWGGDRAGPPLGRPDCLEQRVELLYIGLGDDGRLAEAAGEYADGLVVAGMGGGHVPPRAAEVLVKLARRLPVVLATRCGAGPVLTSTYRGSGSETHLLERGLLPVGHLSPLKARLRLMVGLALGLPPGELFPTW